MAAKTWFQESITSLLTAPGPIHMPKLPFGMRGGHGPIDVFSTRFANLFTDDVDAMVNGESLDKDGLKDKLVTIKKQYNPSSATFSDVGGSSGVWEVAEGEHVLTKLDWTQVNTQGAEETISVSSITWDARLQHVSGNLRKIQKLGITTDILPN